MDNKREPFKIVVEYVCFINGSGTWVSGKIDNDGNTPMLFNVDIHGKNRVISNVEAVRGTLCRRPPELMNDGTVALRLKDISKDDVEVGDILIEKID